MGITVKHKSFVDPTLSGGKSVQFLNTPSHNSSALSLRSRGARRSARAVVLQQKDRKFDGKHLVKQAQFYFQNHPTCLKQASSSDSTPKIKKKVSYTRQLLETDSSESKSKKSKYITKNPYYEDKQSYNLDACI